MKSPPILQQSDEDAEAQAAQSRMAGAAVVQDHLSNHLQNNSGRSSEYVSWIATLHPENADVTIDQRFLIPGNPWWTIYEDAKNDVPTATVVPVVEHEQGDEEAAAQGHHSGANTAAPPSPHRPHCILLCSPIDMIGGIFVTCFAIMGVLLCEGVALLIYLVAASLYWIAKIFDPPNAFTGMFYSFFMIFYFAFALADSIVLLASVLVTECVACAGWLLSVLLGGIMAANTWHQYIRRICHLIRWGFRGSCAKPPRHFAMCCMTDEKEELLEMPEPIAVESMSTTGPSSSRNRSPTNSQRVYEVNQEDIVIEGEYHGAK